MTLVGMFQADEDDDDNLAGSTGLSDPRDLLAAFFKPGDARGRGPGDRHGQKLIKSHESDQLPETLKKHYPKLLEEIRKMRSIICAKTRIFASSDAESILRVKKFIDWSTINYIEYGIWSFTSEGKRSHSEKREELSKLIQRYHFLAIEKIDSKSKNMHTSCTKVWGAL